MAVYYNEIEPYAALWLKNLIKAGLIPDGEVDERSIVDVRPDDLRGYSQCHFFAGIGGWSHALRLAEWPDDRPIWTGSCPCQPFSVAGKGRGVDDERHLWPHFFRLIRGCRPQVIMGEQVAGSAGYGWLDGVRFDLASEDYSIEGVDIPACAANAPHIRSRLFWVSVDNSKSVGQEYRKQRCSDEGAFKGDQRRQKEIGIGCSLRDMADANNAQWRAPTKDWVDDLNWTDFGWEKKTSGYKLDSQTNDIGRDDRSSYGKSFWHDAVWLNGADGKTRRAQPNICLLAHGIPARVGKLRAYGNAIVPPLAAEIIKSFMETQYG